MSSQETGVGVCPEQVAKGLHPNLAKLSQAHSVMGAVRYQLHSEIMARRNMSQRTSHVSRTINQLEQDLRQLQSMLVQSADRYRRTELELTRSAQEIQSAERPSLIWARAQFKEIGEIAGTDWRPDPLSIYSAGYKKNLSDEIWQTTKVKKKRNPFKAAWNFVSDAVEESGESFREIGVELWQGAQERGTRAFHSKKDFLNWITLGVGEGLISPAKERAALAFTSKYRFFDWITLGRVEAVRGTLNPDDPFSKEHWLDSLDAATMGIGGILAKSALKSSSVNGIKPGKKDDVGGGVGSEGTGNTLNRIDSGSGHIPMDADKFNRMKNAFENQGGLIVKEEEALPLLNYHGVEASTLDATTIAFRPNPSTSAVFEKFIHATQYRTGRANGTNIIEMEIEAKEKLINFRKAYGIPNSETRDTIQQLREYRQMLEK